MYVISHRIQFGGLGGVDIRKGVDLRRWTWRPKCNLGEPSRALKSLKMLRFLEGLHMHCPFGGCQTAHFLSVFKDKATYMTSSEVPPQTPHLLGSKTHRDRLAFIYTWAVIMPFSPSPQVDVVKVPLNVTSAGRLDGLLFVKGAYKLPAATAILPMCS